MDSFVRVAAAIPEVRVADCAFNAREITRAILEADRKGARMIVFPELSLTGYTCGDLFLQKLLLDRAVNGMRDILDATVGADIVSIVGLPLRADGQLFNVAVVLHGGSIMGVVPKCYLPNYKEFYEQRWFSSSFGNRSSECEILGQRVPLGHDLLFRTPECTFGIELCEDLWAPVPPSSCLAMNGAEIIFNLSASDECVGKHNYLCNLVSLHSAQLLSGYVYSSCGCGESSTDVVFTGNGLICENGSFLAKAERFSMEPQLLLGEIDVERLRNERLSNTTFRTCRRQMCHGDYRTIDISQESSSSATRLIRKIEPHPFIPAKENYDNTCHEIFSIQCAGLAKRLRHTRAESVVIGISGGLDSTLALLVCVRTMDLLGWNRDRVIGVTMPGFGTTGRTYGNAVNMIKALGCALMEISITEACRVHFRDIGHDEELHDIVYENAQARERTQILMDLANKHGGLVIGTGDLSEIALGWSTYNGDHISMYGVNAGIPKTLVRHLVQWVAEHQENQDIRHILLDVADTPVSPELLPSDEEGNIQQCTEEVVGPYELHDFFLYNFIRHGMSPEKLLRMAELAFGEKYSRTTLEHWSAVFFRRFFSQQFKRSCIPDGPKVGSISLSPRGDWRMPSDASPAMWLDKVCE